MELTGFDSKEIEKMFSNNDKPEIQEDDFDVDTVAEKPPFVKTMGCSVGTVITTGSYIAEWAGFCVREV